MKFWAFQPMANSDEIDLLVYGYIAESALWSDEVGAKEFRQALAEHAAAKRINVRINSGGGDAFAGIAIHSMLQAHPAEVVCYVEGLAGSAASLIAMAGSRTVMARGSMIMIHNPSALAMGEASDLRQTADVLDKLRDSLVAIYEAKTGKSPAELQTLLDAETWLTADEAVAEGFADEVAGQPVAITAKGDAVFFNSVSFPRAAVPKLASPELAKDTDQRPAAITREQLATENPELLASLLEDGRQAGRNVPLTMDDLNERASDLVAAIRAESLAQGRAEAIEQQVAEGVAKIRSDVAATSAAAERARIQAIENMAIRGHRELTASAKYGAEGVEPMTPEAYAMAVLQAERQQQAKHLTDAAADAADSFVPSAPPPERGAADAAYVDHLVKVGAAASSAGRRQ